MKLVKKRTGNVVPFDENKIKNVIFLGFSSAGEEVSSAKVAELSKKVCSAFSKSLISVEDIQDEIEKVLIHEDCVAPAIAFIRYRYKRNLERLQDSSILDKASTLSSPNSNGNINDATAMGKMLTYGTTLSKEMALRSLVSKDVMRAHRSGDIHIHDLDFYPTGTLVCCQTDIKKVLEGGLILEHGAIREPNSIKTAAILTCITLQSSQNDQMGGQSIANFDYGLASYVAKSFCNHISDIVNIFCESNIFDSFEEESFKKVFDHIYHSKGTVSLRDAMEALTNHSYCNDSTKYKYIILKAWALTEKEALQAMESVVHNLNTMHSRAGSQVPFTSLNFGTDTTDEGRLVIKTLLQAIWLGLGEGEIPIFPIAIFKTKEGINVNKGDPNYDLYQMSKVVSAKHMYPSYTHIDAESNIPYYMGTPETEIATMGAVSGDCKVSIYMPYITEEDTTYISFESLWRALSKIFTVEKEGKSNYMDLVGVKIYDSYSSRYVDCYKIIKNPSKTLSIYKITFSDNTSILCTCDHPWPTKRGRVFTENLKIGDSIKNSEGDDLFVIKLAPQTGMELETYDVTTETDRFDVNHYNTHNCRTRVISNVNGPNTPFGRGCASFTSINLPRIALETDSPSHFFNLLTSKLNLCKNQLIDRLKYQGSFHKYNFPFLMSNNWIDADKLKDDDTLEQTVKQASLSIGFVGLAETVYLLTGHTHDEDEYSSQLGLEIVKFIRDFTDQATKDTHLNFATFATPAESVAGRFYEMDKSRYPEVFEDPFLNKGFYTNSFHVPVEHEISYQRKIDIEAPYHTLCNGGHITYVEYDGDPLINLKAFSDIVDYSQATHKIGYFAINHPYDEDPVCGYKGIINGDICPKCGRDFRVPLTDLEYEKLHSMKKPTTKKDRELSLKHLQDLTNSLL